MSQVEKQTFIVDLVKGSTAEDFFYMSSITPRETKAGKAYWTIELSDKTGTLSCNMWDREAFVGAAVPNNPGFVKVRLSIDAYQGKIQGVIKIMRKLDEGEETLDRDFLPTGPYDKEEQFEKLKNFITTWVEHPGLKKMCLSVLESGVGQQLKNSPAAKGNHHAYVGGLVDHISSMCQLTIKLCEHYLIGQQSQDLLIAACLFHDLGKVEELSCDVGGINYTTRGSLIGHVSISLQYIEMFREDYWTGVEESIVDRQFDGKNDAQFEQCRTDLIHLEHLVASHHGKKEWGAAQVPLSREAQLFHLIDMVDSRMALYDNLEKETTDSEGFAPWSKQVEGRPFITDKLVRQ